MRSASSHLAPVPADRLREPLPAGGGLTGRPSSAGCFPAGTPARQLSACPLLWTEPRAPSWSQREGPEAAAPAPPCAPLSQVPPALGSLW